MEKQPWNGFITDMQRYLQRKNVEAEKNFKNYVMDFPRSPNVTLGLLQAELYLEGRYDQTFILQSIQI